MYRWLVSNDSLLSEANNVHTVFFKLFLMISPNVCIKVIYGNDWLKNWTVWFFLLFVYTIVNNCFCFLDQDRKKKTPTEIFLYMTMCVVFVLRWLCERFIEPFGTMNLIISFEFLYMSSQHANNKTFFMRMISCYQAQHFNGFDWYILNRIWLGKFGEG